MKKPSTAGRTRRTVTDAELKIPGRVLIGKPTMRQKIPLCDATIYEMERVGKFPQRVSLGKKRVAWFEDEVEAWINQLARAQLAPPRA